MVNQEWKLSMMHYNYRKCFEKNVQPFTYTVFKPLLFQEVGELVVDV